MTRKLLEKYIRSLVKEQVVDEPKGGPYGKVLFAPERTDEVEPEENTEQEEELFRALSSHYENNEKDALESLFPSLRKLAKKDKYAKFLQTPDGKKAYRVLALGKSQLKTQMGINPKQIPENEGIIVDSGILKPGPAKLQSWTLRSEPKFLGNILGDATGLDILDNEEALVIVVSNTSNGEFYFNPEFIKNIQYLGDFYGEQEVLSYGKVPYEHAFVCLVNSAGDELTFNAAPNIVARNSTLLKGL